MKLHETDVVVLGVVIGGRKVSLSMRGCRVPPRCDVVVAAPYKGLMAGAMAGDVRDRRARSANKAHNLSHDRHHLPGTACRGEMRRRQPGDYHLVVVGE